jgi:peptidoglycan/LPS O-acetylase OafA/YrhL
MSYQPRIPALDGLRGLAILAVLSTHASFWISDTGFGRVAVRLMSIGTYGVDLFFVLSGFLITQILLRTRDAQNRASSFYSRRTLRIFPIYYLTLLLALAFGCLFPHLQSLKLFHHPIGVFGYIF